MRIIKEDSDFGKCYFIGDKECYLGITFGGNDDLYWSIHSKNRTEDNDPKEDSITITKENYALYSLFDKLYDDIKEINIFDEYKENKEKYRLYNHSNYHELFDEENKTITWYSDETAHEVANYLKIKKEDDSYRLDFHIQEYKEGYDMDFNSLFYIPIRFRNSGSRYDPFNIVFMKMYGKLRDIEDAYEYGHQIHMEEYLYQKEKTLVKKKAG